MGKKIESNFRNMVLVLFGVTLISSAAVAYVYSLTISSINEAKKNKQANAIRHVIPGEFNNDPVADAWKVKTPDGGELEFFPAKKEEETIGTAVKTYTKDGFGGQIWLMVGFNPDGTISNYSVLEHKETPGLGSKMDLWFTKDGKGSIIGKNPGTTGLRVKKDGGEVDAITAATISSRAFLDAVNRASAALAGNADTYSGATSKSTGEAEKKEEKTTACDSICNHSCNQ